MYTDEFTRKGDDCDEISEVKIFLDGWQTYQDPMEAGSEVKVFREEFNDGTEMKAQELGLNNTAYDKKALKYESDVKMESVKSKVKDESYNPNVAYGVKEESDEEIKVIKEVIKMEKVETTVLDSNHLDIAKPSTSSASVSTDF